MKLPNIPPLPEGSTVTRLSIEVELGHPPKPGSLLPERPILTLDIQLDNPVEQVLELMNSLELKQPPAKD